MCSSSADRAFIKSVNIEKYVHTMETLLLSNIIIVIKPELTLLPLTRFFRLFDCQENKSGS